jgi:signal transduction histidine kinase
MKLLTQTNRRYLRIAVAVLLAGGAALFMGVRSLFNYFADERLAQLQEEIANYEKSCDTLPIFFQSTNERLAVRPIGSGRLPEKHFGDTTLFNEVRREIEPYRRLRFGAIMRGTTYQVDLFQSAVKTEDIAKMAFLLTFFLIAVMLAALFLVQRRLSVRLWQPFYETLDRLRAFRLTQPGPLNLAATDTDEFVELNTALVRLTEKVSQDYSALKRFTENASHEIQTPLAVIRAKLEMLLQSEELQDGQLAQLHTAQQAAGRLSRLQQVLLLLVKIENDQFQTREPVDLKKQVENKIDLLEDFISAKQLNVNLQLEKISIHMNPFLAETLLANLLGNAVKHNLTGGWIRVSLTNSGLVITNSGNPLDVTPSQLFERFRRSTNQQDGMGLGLAIVKEICDNQGLTVNYSYKAGEHTVNVGFPA